MLIRRLKRRALMRLFWQRHDLNKRLWESQPEPDWPKTFKESEHALLVAMSSAHEKDQFRMALTAIECAVHDGYPYTPEIIAEHLVEMRWGSLWFWLDLILHRIALVGHSGRLRIWEKHERAL